MLTFQGGFAPFHPQLLFLLIEKVTKKIKACTITFPLSAKFILFALGGAQGDLLIPFGASLRLIHPSLHRINR